MKFINVICTEMKCNNEFSDAYIKERKIVLIDSYLKNHKLEKIIGKLIVYLMIAIPVLNLHLIQCQVSRLLVIRKHFSS